MTDMRTSPAPVTLRTRSGQELLVRPAEPSDEAVLAAFFDAVSDEDRRFRFLSAVQHVGRDQLEHMTHGDHEHSENFLAFDPAGGALLASAMLAADAAMEVAEVAISIRADHRGQGIGWSLLEYVAGQARSRGIKCLQCIESRENHAAIELEREMGFTAAPFEGDPTLIVLEARF